MEKLLRYFVIVFFNVIGIIPVAFFLFMPQANAQPTCSQQLERARHAFENGQVTQVEGFLRLCISDGGFTDKELSEANKLIILSALYLDRDEKAEEAMLGLLRIDKEYTFNPDDEPAEFSRLYQKFRTYPVAALGIVLGFNVYNPSPTGYFGVHNTDANRPKYKAQFSVLQAGISADMRFNTYIRLNADFMLFKKRIPLTKNSMILPPKM
jgi:hypothetical protein